MDVPSAGTNSSLNQTGICSILSLSQSSDADIDYAHAGGKKVREQRVADLTDAFTSLVPREGSTHGGCAVSRIEKGDLICGRWIPTPRNGISYQFHRAQRHAFDAGTSL